LSQIYWRIIHKIKIIKIDLSAAPRVRHSNGAWSIPAKSTIRMIERSRFKFLNETYELNSNKDWNNSSYSKLWLYNLHYFEDLNSYDSDLRNDWHKELISRWINENEPGFGNGWEPYPISLRIVNWIKWVKSGNVVKVHWLNSLATQARYLENSLEYHLLGNHLFANAKALVFAGLFFEGNEANKWYSIGMGIIEKEIIEQVLEDGGNFELSTMYHSIFLEDLLDIVNILNNNSISVPEVVINTACRMLHWLGTMTHPDKKISLFNDAAQDIAKSPFELSSYAQRLGLPIPKGNTGITYLKNSGYIRYEDPRLVLIADLANVGPDYIPGHAHADTLTFELSLYTERIFVNTGTSVYGNSKIRLEERGTAAHNTVMIDGENSSEVWSGFRVARRARVFNTIVNQTESETVFKSSHTGYKRLPGKPIHTRTWEIHDCRCIISDNITGKKNHRIQNYLHLHPKIRIKKLNHFEYMLSSQYTSNIKISFNGYENIELLPFKYHSEFGKTEISSMFSCEVTKELPVDTFFIINW